MEAQARDLFNDVYHLLALGFDPEKAPHIRWFEPYLDDEAISPQLRLAIANCIRIPRSETGKFPVLPLEIARRTLLFQVPGYEAGKLRFGDLNLREGLISQWKRDDPQWLKDARAVHASVSANGRVKDNRSSFLELCALLGDTGQMDRLLKQGVAAHPEMAVRLLQSGRLDALKRCIEALGPRLKVNGEWSDEIHEPVETLVASLEPQLACFAAALFYALEDSPTTPPKIDRVRRLRKLAERFRATSFENADLRRRVIEALGREPETFLGAFETQSQPPAIDEVTNM